VAAVWGAASGRGLPKAQAWQPSARYPQPQRARLQPSTWGLLATTSHMPPPNSAVHSENTCNP